RFELLYEAGLAAEAQRDGVATFALDGKAVPPPGAPMMSDHRRILATAMGRLRAKLKYRPVVFELMPEDFTLLQLQRTVEAILGSNLHKQNFRRLVENSGLVESTGEIEPQTRGRPAAKFRFRREVLRERLAAGVRISGSR
ncbi:MAG TPA: NAD regulator, partial [Alphaproteobacteria bacterium]|nr:NAD regulator [Alphaproteobacteria bacterium]